MAKKELEKIGIYIDYNSIVATYFEKDKEKIFSKKIFSLDTNYKIEGLIKPLSLNNEFFHEKQQWVSAFKENLKKSNLSSKNVIVSLSHNFSVTRFFTMPFVERKFWNKAIPIESKKHIPVAFDELGYDFFAVPILENSKIGVLFSVTQKKTTEFLNQIIKDAGLILEAVEPVVYTFYRISEYLTNGKDTYIFIYNEDDDFYTSLVWNKIPILYRYISFSKTPSFSDRKTLDLKGSIMFFQRNIPNIDIENIFIAGNNLEFLTNHVKKEIQTDPIPIDIKTKINLPDESFEILASSSASLKEIVKTTYMIDISENQKSKRHTQIANNFIILVTSLLVAFFTLLYMFNLIKVYNYSQKISDYESQMPELSEFENIPIPSIEENVKQLSRIAKGLRLIMEKREYFTPKLSAVADTIPKDMWAKSVMFVNPTSLDQTNFVNIDFIIEAETYLLGETRSYYVDYFLKELKKKKAFEICNPPNGRFDYEAKDPENVGFININQNDLKKITSKVKISCSAKK